MPDRIAHATARKHVVSRGVSSLVSAPLCSTHYSGLSEQNNWAHIGRALQPQSPHIALDFYTNSQVHSQNSLEDTRHTNTDLSSFTLPHHACVSRNRGPDTGLSGHLAQLLACRIPLTRASQRYESDISWRCLYTEAREVAIAAHLTFISLLRALSNVLFASACIEYGRSSPGRY
jgi:hypothetical protein